MCGKKRDISNFSIRKNPNKTTLVYFKSRCKSCSVKMTKLWIELNRSKFNEYHKEYQRNKHE